MDLPKLVELDEVISATEWNKMVDCLRSLIPCPSDDIIPSQNESGTTWSLRKQKNTFDDAHPFKIVAISGTTFGVAYGTVGNVVPTMGSTPLNNYDPPSMSGSGDVWIECAVSGSTVTSAQIKVGTFPGNDPEDDSIANVLLGEIRTVGGERIAQQACIHSLSYHQFVEFTEEGMQVAHLFGAI